MTHVKKSSPSPKLRLEKSIAALEADYSGKEIARGIIAHEFIDTTTADNFEERLAQLPSSARARRANGKDGWIALRGWARQQPWVEEEKKRVAEIMARSTPTDDAEYERRGVVFTEHLRMLGVLFDKFSAATTDEEADVIRKQMDELEESFKKNLDPT